MIGFAQFVHQQAQLLDEVSIQNLPWNPQIISDVYQHLHFFMRACSVHASRRIKLSKAAPYIQNAMHRLLTWDSPTYQADVELVKSDPHGLGT